MTSPLNESDELDGRGERIGWRAAFVFTSIAVFSVWALVSLEALAVVAAVSVAAGLMAAAAVAILNWRDRDGETAG